MPLRTRLAVSAVLAALVIAGCSSAPAPVIVPPPPAPPSVALSPRLIEMASAYRAYMVRTTGIAPDFADGPAIASSLRTGAAYEPEQMVRGAMAYAAVVALQDKSFVDGVRVYVGDRAQRQKIAYEILKDPAYVLGINGAQSAAARVVAALGGDGQSLYDEGKAVKQAAYDLQRQPWSKVDVQERESRLASAKSASAAAMLGDVAETTRLQQASLGATSLGAAPIGVAPATTGPPYTTTVVRGLAIAALAALGQAGDAELPQIMALMNEPNIGRCMSMSKLNLYQCLAVARPHYEDVFCLGQHAMMDTGRCMIKAAGLTEPYEARFVPDAKSIARGMDTKKAPPKKGKKRS